MMHGISGQAAFVTGGAGGIGAAVARGLARRGAFVFVTDIRLADAVNLVKQIRDDGGTAEACELDVSSPAAIEAAVGAASEAYGPVRLGVACAGVIDIAAAEDVIESGWDRTMAINLKGTFFTLQALARQLKASGQTGSMVAISSTSGRVGRPDCVDYAASKAGVISVVRSLSLALAPAIRVNAVCPSVVDTPMTTHIHQERARAAGIGVGESLSAALATIPLGRAEQPDDVADAIIFLLSDYARFVTGQALNVCGGVLQD
jgi:NAD(P)-dependent dehydrogenase (short-subunit alcohol dehydrogenase family)